VVARKRDGASSATFRCHQILVGGGRSVISAPATWTSTRPLPSLRASRPTPGKIWMASPSCRCSRIRKRICSGKHSTGTTRCRCRTFRAGVRPARYGRGRDRDSGGLPELRPERLLLGSRGPVGVEPHRLALPRADDPRRYRESPQPPTLSRWSVAVQLPGRSSWAIDSTAK
jgi:hypothetical protein